MNYFTQRLRLLKINAINTYHIQTAYFFENIAGSASTMFYTLAMLIFIKAIYTNVKLFAGYTESEMLLLVFFIQLNFHIGYIWSVSNINYLIESVRVGELDLILTKPVPAMFYVTFKDLSFVNFLKEGVPNLLLLILVINWPEFSLTLGNVSFAAAILILGQICAHCFRFLFALPTFFTGNAEQLFRLSSVVTDPPEIPYDGITGNVRILFTTLIPALIASQISVSVFLGKSDALTMFVFSLGVAVVFLVIKSIGWKIALRNYTSASS